MKAEELTELIKGSIKEATENLTEENKKPFGKQKEKLLDDIGRILKGLEDKIGDAPVADALKKLAAKIVEGINQLADTKERRIFVQTCVLIVDKLPDPNKSEIDRLLVEFFSQGDSKSLELILGLLEEDGKRKLLERYPKVFKKRAIEDARIFDAMYPLAPSDTKTVWLIELVASDHKRALKVIDKQDYQTSNDKKIIETILNKVQSLPPSEKKPLYNVVNKMHCAKDDNQINELMQQLRTLLTSKNKDEQETGYESLQDAFTYLSDKQKRDISRQIIEWLRSPQAAHAYLPYTNRSILPCWDILDPPVKHNYVDYLFRNLIVATPTTPGMISLGFEILLQLDITYDKNYSTYFDDTLTTLLNGPSEKIRLMLENGLHDLKPEKMTKENQPFWEKVQEALSQNAEISEANHLPTIKDQVIGKQFVFGIKGRNPHGNITLSPDGKISGYKCPNETSWEFNDDNQLVFKHKDGRISTVFEECEHRDGKYYFEGPFKFKQGVVHVLEEV